MMSHVMGGGAGSITARRRLAAPGRVCGLLWHSQQLTQAALAALQLQVEAESVSMPPWGFQVEVPGPSGLCQSLACAKMTRCPQSEVFQHGKVLTDFGGEAGCWTARRPDEESSIQPLAPSVIAPLNRLDTRPRLNVQSVFLVDSRFVSISGFINDQRLSRSGAVLSLPSPDQQGCVSNGP